MFPEDEIWRDRYLYEIPALKCDIKNLDYVAIISRFHQLLLKKNKKTYEEFVKYWSLLIITSPYPFRGYSNVSDEKQLFSGVYDDAVKFNRPIEVIELQAGQPKLVEADIFIDQDKEVKWRSGRTDKEEKGSITINDRRLYNWYTKPENLLEARTFFGLYCLNLFRAFTKSKVSIVNHCCGKFVDRYQSFSGSYAKPNTSMSFDAKTAIYLRAAFRAQVNTYRKILRMAIDKFKPYIINKPTVDLNESDDEALPYLIREKEKIFFDYSIKTPLRCFGLSSTKVLRYREHHNSWRILSGNQVTDTIKETDDEKLISSMCKIYSQIGDICRRNRENSEKSLSPKDDTYELWEYSRLLSPEFLKSVGNEENLEFLAFTAGLHNRPEMSVDNIQLLKKFDKRPEYFQMGQAACGKLNQIIEGHFLDLVSLVSNNQAEAE